MTTRYFGAPIQRNEDARLLTGRALFVDDVELPGMLHAAFLRSRGGACAHRPDRRLRARSARAGVVAVYTADDLGDYWQPGPLLVPPPPIAGIIFNQRTQVPLAQGQGAPRRRAARDGDRREPLHRRGRARRHRGRARSAAGGGRSRAALDAVRRRGARRLGANVAAHVRQTKGDYAAARARAAHRDAPALPLRPRHVRRRSRRAASSRTGTPAPTSSPCGTRPRRRCSSATGSPACWACASGRCG